MIKIILTAVVLLSLGSVSASADASKGQRLYLKKLKSVCGFNGAKMAEKHSTIEWEKLHDANKIADEIRKECPKVKDSALKDKYDSLLRLL